MFCPKCGKINPDDKELCSGCNTPLHEENKEEPIKKKGNILKVIVAAIIIVVAAVVVTVSFSGCTNKTITPDTRMDISF